MKIMVGNVMKIAMVKATVEYFKSYMVMVIVMQNMMVISISIHQSN